MKKRYWTIDNDIRPVRYFEETAEFGLLEEMLNTRLRRQFETDLNFRKDMLEILYKHSKQPIPLLEFYILKDLSASLEYFLEKTEEWTNQKP